MPHCHCSPVPRTELWETVPQGASTSHLESVHVNMTCAELTVCTTHLAKGEREKEEGSEGGQRKRGRKSRKERERALP